MSAFIIQTKSKNKLQKIVELANEIGINVLKVEEKQYEDFLLGTMMTNFKTSKNVSRKTIMKKLAQE